MHLALVTHNVYVGDGQGRVNRELTRYLLRQGVAVTLVADRIDEGLLDEGAAWIPVHPGFEKVDLLKVWRFRALADAVLDRERARFDVVMGCGVVLSRPHSLNAVHFVHGTWLRSPFHAAKARPGVNGAYQWLFSALNARWEREAFAAARQVVAVSPMVAAELAQVGVPSEKIETVINGVDLDEYRPGPADRKALGLPEGVVLGLFAGDIRSPIKNLDGLLRGVAETPGLHLAVAGRPEGSPYPALARDLGIADRVHFLGFRRDTADLMRACDFFALVSRRDSCPLVMLEAMAAGLPVVTARTVGTWPLVADAGGVVLAGPDDHAALGDGLRRLTADADLRTRLGAASRAVAERHSWERMAAHYLRLFEAFAARKGTATAVAP